MVYQSNLPCITLIYVEGVLHMMLVDKEDLVLYEGLKHHVAFYEEDLSPKHFKPTNEIPS